MGPHSQAAAPAPGSSVVPEEGTSFCTFSVCLNEHASDMLTQSEAPLEL